MQEQKRLIHPDAITSGQAFVPTDLSIEKETYPYYFTFCFTALYFMISHGRVHLLVPALTMIPCAMISGIMAVAAFAIENGKVREKHVWRREEKLVLGLLAVCILTLPTSVWPGGSVSTLYKGFLPAIILMFISAAICRSISDIKKFVWLLCFNSVFIIFMVLSNDITHISKGITDTYDTNDIAMVLDCSLPIIFYFMQSCRGIKKLILSIICVLILITVVKTASRGGMLGLIAFGGYLVLYSRARFKYFMAVVAALICIVMFAPDESKHRFSTMINPETEYDQNLGDRTQIWKAGVEHFWESPLVGVGFSNYAVAGGTKEEGWGWKTAHNSALQIAVELGVGGLILYIMLTAGTYFKFRRLRKEAELIDHEHETVWLLKGIEVSLLLYMVTAFFLSQAYSPLFYFIISLAIATQKFLPMQLSHTVEHAL